MSVFRVHKTKDFTILPTSFLKEKDMTLKSKGLLSIMLSLPDNWDYSVLGLTQLSKDGKDSVMSSLEELQRFGYVKIESIRNAKGQYESHYDVYEKPMREIRIGSSESEKHTQYNNINNNNVNNPPITLFDNKDNIPQGKIVDEEFERFWNLYGKKTQRAQAERMWKRLTKLQKQDILSKVPMYVASTPDLIYRMNPATYINPANRRWEDEIRVNNTSMEKEVNHVVDI